MGTSVERYDLGMRMGETDEVYFFVCYGSLGAREFGKRREARRGAWCKRDPAGWKRGDVIFRLTLQSNETAKFLRVLEPDS